MAYLSTGNDTVDFMNSIAIVGNVVPQIWYKTVTRSEEDKRPYLLAISILADIVYWYRPTEIRDEYTGQIVGIKKKFKDDMLQRSYKSLCELYGENEKAIQRALLRLEKLGVIKRLFKTVKTEAAVLGNVMFLDLLPDGLIALTFPVNEDGLPVLQIGEESYPMDTGVHRGGQICPEGVDKYVQRYGQICPDITKNNTKNIITNIKSSSNDEGGEQYDDDDLIIKNKIGYDALIDTYPESQELINEIVKLMRRLEKIPDDSKMQINGNMFPVKEVKKRLRKITYMNINEIMNYLTRCNRHISNKSNYLLTVLFNASGGGNKTDKHTAKKNAFNDFPQQEYDFDKLEVQLMNNLYRDVQNVDDT